MRHWFNPEFTLTKRHVGLVLIAAGLAGIMVMVGAAWMIETTGGFGTVQTIGTLAGAASIGIGATLLPLGNQPA